MAANKITINGATLIDLSQDTAQESDVATGKYFHKANGQRVQGTGAVPTGKITISQNGTDIDVAQYATADVAVYDAKFQNVLFVNNATKPIIVYGYRVGSDGVLQTIGGAVSPIESGSSASIPCIRYGPVRIFVSTPDQTYELNYSQTYGSVPMITDNTHTSSGVQSWISIDYSTGRITVTDRS